MDKPNKLDFELAAMTLNSTTNLQRFGRKMDRDI